MRPLSRLFLAAYRTYTRIMARCFSLFISGAFDGFGSKTVLMYPLRLSGENRIRIGASVFMGSGCWLQTLPDGDNRDTAMVIGSGTSIAGSCVISAVRSVRLEENVLVARNVYISDHIHRYTDPDLPILAQGVSKVAPVWIKRGAWLGQNVVICPGVTVGVGSVVAANSVVNQDIPDYCVAGGSPARVLKRFGPLEVSLATSV
jgi:acetyltransferase-like isoleucine patch superfamily enzyme